MVRGDPPYDAEMEAVDPIRSLTAALADVAGSRRRARAPGRRAPRRLRDERRAAARGRAAAAAARGRGGAGRRGSCRSTASSGVDVAGPGFLNVTVDDAWLGRRAVGGPRRRARRSAAGSADPAERDPGRARLREPDRPDHRRGGPERRVRRRGRAPARVRRASGRARVLLQRRRRADGPLPRVRRGDSPRRGAARGRLPRRLRRRARARAEGDPRAADARADRGGARALPRSTSTRSSGRASSSPRSPRRSGLLETYEAEGALWAQHERPRRRQGPRRRPLGRHADLLRGRRRVHPAQVRAGLRAARLRARRRPPRLRRAPRRRWRRCSATRATSVEVLIYQLVHLTRGGEAAKMSKRRGDVVFLDDFVDEIGVDAARWYLLSRGHDQTIEIDVDLAAERSQKNPVYYVQYAHARIAGILRNAEGSRRPTRAPSAAARRPRSAISSSACSSCPRSSARRPSGAGRTRSPTYAIRVADDFHRFYHHHRVLGSDAGGLPPRALRRDARRRRHVPRPDRRRGARADVSAVRVSLRERSDRAMRWNLALGGLAASWGFIAVLVAAVDARRRGPRVLAARARRADARCRRARRGQAQASSRRAAAWRRSSLLGVVQGAHWLLFFEAVEHGSVALAVLTFYAAPLVIALVAPLVLPERLSLVVLGACLWARRGSSRSPSTAAGRDGPPRVGRRRRARLGDHIRGARDPRRSVCSRRRRRR